MVKLAFATLVLAYCTYSIFIYANCSTSGEAPTHSATAGMELWQSKNCQSCHQLYGLGGYMGPDLTNIISDSTKGPLYTAAFIKMGTARMPNFNLSDTETDQLVAFLRWVDKSGRSIVPADKVNWYGNYTLTGK
ncbi:MAG: c-type cytochrome [Ferruginibacter sp.]